MKKLLSLFLAVLFLMGTVNVSLAEGATFKGTVSNATGESLTITNEFGTALTFAVEDPAKLAAVGSTVTVTYSGDITSKLVVDSITVDAAPVQLSASGEITAVDASGFTMTLADGTAALFTFTDATVITGVAGALEAGQQATVTYVETSVGRRASAVEVTEVPVAQDVIAVVTDDTLNKKLTGTVTKLTSSKITIKTRKGKTWSFKRTSKTTESGKYKLKVGATVTITYDGYASKVPAAKKIYVSKAAPSVTYKKKSGIVEYYHDGMIKLTNGFLCDAYSAKHRGDGERDAGTSVTITYYVNSSGVNMATKVKWKG